ncbi:SDR family NAD(P)-dependent oxidoreductase [Corynebacterium timonense]|uniref:3-oxoacyl-[acyl-carrier protein] reductase n=1 Tax=Corynebacterium timonense TaxID=441500 RepID=A0A1H1UXQ2_9CORY|nr:SDR family NAD(P)-dependent oxidoreductase [Corynebacterium timonense]SDS77312.1 3-oxoacyl-[acyl-carrier protein] reductase [Corynebacterium timonense]
MNHSHPFSPSAFAGQRALITGAAGGIGAACAELFAAAGADLILADVDAERVDTLAAELGARAAAGDLTDPAARAELVGLVEAAGGVDLLVPAAGVYPEAPVTEMSDEAWERVFAVNLGAVFALTRDLAAHVRDGGAVVTFGSIAGARGSRNHSAYAATKGAIASFTRSIALEFAGRAIRANAVAPGIIETAMSADLVAGSGESLLANTPLGRLGTAREVAGVVAFLCSDAASFITGEVIHVNGGLHMG